MDIGKEVKEVEFAPVEPGPEVAPVHVPETTPANPATEPVKEPVSV